MKKSLLALAVLAASGAAMAQSSVTLYGVADTGVTYTSGKEDVYGLTLLGGNTNSRLGFRGVEDLGGGLKALFNLQALPRDDALFHDSIKRCDMAAMRPCRSKTMARELVVPWSSARI